MVYISCVDACPIKPGFKVGIFVICLIGLITKRICTRFFTAPIQFAITFISVP